MRRTTLAASGLSRLSAEREGHCCRLAIGPRSEYDPNARVIGRNEDVVALVEEETRAAAALDLELATVGGHAHRRAGRDGVGARESRRVIGAQRAIRHLRQLDVRRERVVDRLL